MKLTHPCPGGCGHEVPNHLFACGDDWFRLPLEICRAITRNYRRDRDAHAQAMADAVQWYADHPLSEPEPDHSCRCHLSAPCSHCTDCRECHPDDDSVIDPGHRIEGVKPVQSYFPPDNQQ